MDKTAEVQSETNSVSSGGVLPRTSKESTPAASSSKEGTKPYLLLVHNCSIILGSDVTEFWNVSQ